jgi:hypothetical protein
MLTRKVLSFLTILCAVVAVMGGQKAALAQTDPVTQAYLDLAQAEDNQALLVPGYGDDLRQVADELAGLGLYALRHHDGSALARAVPHHER